MKTDRTAFQAELEAAAREKGAKAFGVADLRKLEKTEPNLLIELESGYSRAVVMGLRLQKAVLEGIKNQPTPIYFHHYRQVNYQLDTMALEIADRLQDAGYRALAIPASQVIRKEPMLGHVCHRMMGWAAGFGHRGRNNLLVHPRFGSQMRYVSVLTDMPLEPDEPIDTDCGSCRACVAVCPARAIKLKPEEFDLAACYAKLTEFSKLPFIGQHICGLCVKACRGRMNREKRNRGLHRQHGE